MNPPLIAESLLSGLIVNSNARDEVLGDLAEEWHALADRDGRARADRWYAREALRSTPHLLRLWSRSVSLPSLGVLLLAACALRLVLAAAGYAGLFGVSLAARTMGLPPVITTIASVVALVCAALSIGAVVIRLDRRAPIVTLAAVGVIAFFTGVQSRPVLDTAVLHPSFYWIVANVLAAPLLLAGGGLALRRRLIGSRT